MTPRPLQTLRRAYATTAAVCCALALLAGCKSNAQRTGPIEADVKKLDGHVGKADDGALRIIILTDKIQ